MVLCQIVAVDNTKVVIVRFVTDREAIKKSKISYNKGFLPLYCPLVCPDLFKCTLYHFCLLSSHWVIGLFNPMQARIHIP